MARRPDLFSASPWWVYLVAALLRCVEGLSDHGVMAITRSGLPEPPTIFKGAAITTAPVAGS
jgi:hypothetical protein